MYRKEIKKLTKILVSSWLGAGEYMNMNMMEGGVLNMRRILLAILIVIICILSYNIPVSFEGVQGQGVYTIEAYNVLDVKLYDYVIEY